MALSRRSILRVGGAAVAIAAAGGATWALTRAPQKAREPWRAAAEGFGDPRLDALAYAILAPNPHNMQPWRIQLEGDDALTVFCEPSRLLPETDPPSRQITIGFGCFLEMLRQAAAAKGYRADMVYFPDGEPQPILDERPVARVRLAEDPGLPADPLFGAALDRRTSRVPFDLERPVDDAALAAVVAASTPGVDAGASSEPGMLAALRALTLEAWEIEWGHAPTRRESIEVTRIGKKAINEQPWGLSLPGAMLEVLHGTGVLTLEKMDEPGTVAYQQSLEFYAKACETSMAFVWSSTAGNTRRDQIEAGRAWVRMHLAANAQGLAFHPLSQALQEFPEMAGPYKKVHDMLAGGPGRTLQMLCRLGFSVAPPPSPREPLEAVLVS